VEKLAMKLSNSIGWCDCSANAVIGCSKVSPGCLNCYAQHDTPARVLRSKGIETWGPKGQRHPVAGFAAKLRRLNKRPWICDKCKRCFDNNECHSPCCQKNNCTRQLRRIRCFADSNSDWLDDRWPVETRVEFLDAIRLAPNVDTLLLTKRPENFKERMNLASAWACLCKEEHAFKNSDLCYWLIDWQRGKPPPNVLLGVSAETQEYADKRIPELLTISAAKRFVSLEPLLGPVELFGTAFETKAPFDIPKYGLVRKREMSPQGEVVELRQHPKQLDWVIVGGESGKNARPCNVEWIRSIVKQCKAAGVPCWVKQLGAFPQMGPDDSQIIQHPKGSALYEWPADLQVRETP
jgi:protein gp37